MSPTPRKFDAVLVLAAAFALFFMHAPAAHAGEWNGIKLTPFAGISEIYDDNVTFSHTDEIEDWITSFNAGLSALYETHVSSVQVSGALHYEVFADNSDFDNLWGDLYAQWKQELSKYDRIQVTDDYVRAEEPRTFQEAFNRTTGRFAYQTNRLAVDYEHDFNPQWGGTARYRNEFTHFSDKSISDSMLNGLGAGFVYHESSARHWMGDYDIKIRDFEHGDDAVVNRVSAAVRQYLTKKSYVDGRIGVDFIDDYVSDTRTEPMFEVRVTDELNETTVVDFGFLKEYSLNSYTQDVFNEWQVSASLSKEFTRRLSASLAVFYGEGEYDTFVRSDELTGANAALSYDFLRNCRGTLKYTFTNVDSSVAFQEYQKNVVTGGVTWTF